MRGDLHYTLTDTDGVAAAVGAPACALEARYNIAPGQQAPVAVRRGRTRVCEHMRWGLLPRGKRGALIHAAPVEAVSGTPLLRDALRKQRCLVIADGCFAWRELKQPIWFHPEPPRPIAFAGVWATNDDDGEPSFAILLGPPLVTRVNDPMPIVLAAEAYEAWLDPASTPDSVIDLLVDNAPIGWRADAVSTRMSSAATDDPMCIEAVGNPNQRELF